MKRLLCAPRDNWQDKVTEVGLSYHTHDSGTYWNEGVYYKFTSEQIDSIEAATNNLHEMCIAAAQKVIDENRFVGLGIPEHAIPFILKSWEKDEFSLYGRFDLAYDGINPPKMLEYNADTPTALVEAAIAQYYWKEDLFPDSDQFNSIHERLIEAFRKLPFTQLHFTGIQDNLEDNQTISYLMDCATQAGLVPKWIAIDRIAFDENRNDFIDVDSSKVFRGLFKLYPWEWMFHEEFGRHLNDSRVQFIEPGWKALLSNKGLLPILWEMYPESEYLLPCYFSPEKVGKNYVKKPLLSREGANVTVVKNDIVMQNNSGEYGEEGFVYQSLADIAVFDGNRPIIGSWIINHYARGIGVREDVSYVTGNTSKFTPHIF